MTVGLLILPTEIRLIIFDFFLRLVLYSRHNGHLRLLQTSTLIAAEAGPIVRQYLCLKDESQIRGLLFNAHRDHLAQVRFAEVANDSRLIRDDETSEVRFDPRSFSLNLCLPASWSGFLRSGLMLIHAVLPLL